MAKDAKDRTIFEVLQEEHRQATALLEELAASGDPHERGRLFLELRSALEAHADCESATFYEELGTYDELAERIEEAEGEHQQMVRDLAELEAAASDGEESWTRQVDQLRRTVEHHVGEEEEMIFPQAQLLLNEAEAIELAERFLAQKRDYAR